MSHQEVPEEPRLIEIAEPYHVIHTLHRGGVHWPDGAMHLLTDLVLLFVRYERVDIIKKADKTKTKTLLLLVCGRFVPFLHRRSAEVVQCLPP